MKLKLDDKKVNEKCSYLYRFEDDYDQIRLRKFRIVSETQCGWWINRWSWNSNDNLKFVYKTGKNNFAKKTKKEAIENYYYRKVRHVDILTRKLRNTKYLLNQAKIILESESND